MASPSKAGNGASGKSVAEDVQIEIPTEDEAAIAVGRAKAIADLLYMAFESNSVDGLQRFTPESALLTINEQLGYVASYFNRDTPSKTN